jgi:thiol-disulfide isomerase/thioredoxin
MPDMEMVIDMNIVRPSGLPDEGRFPSLGGAIGWLNSAPLTPAALLGHVVLVDFWTYTCINWLRTLPYVRAWAERYAEHGLVVVGVHTPEFAFEKDVDNVRRAVTDRRIEYPVAIDSDYAVWNAFGNRYWPALYFVDARGSIRRHHFGEGEYEQSERVIQLLLADAGVAGVPQDLVSVVGRAAEAPADWDDLGSPETYLGYDRAENFASPGGAAWDTSSSYVVPEHLKLNHWALAGSWTIKGQGAALVENGGSIAYRFQARDVHLVMGPANLGTDVLFRVSVDGQPPGDAHGSDVDAGGNGSVSAQRLYQLIRQSGPITERTLQITFADPGVEAYVFTFG